jgi:hypothetical protein
MRLSNPRTNRARRLLRAARCGCLTIGIASGLLGAGCEDVDWLWWQGTGQQRAAQPRRVIRRTAPTITGRTPVRPADETTSPSAEEAPAAEPARAAAPAPPPDGGESFYQLLLLSEPAGAPAPDNVRQVQLRHARAVEMGAVVESLYVPVGPGGTEDRYFLIYESAAEWVAAHEVCRYLDVPADGGESAAANDPGVEFEHTLSSYYRAIRSGAPSESDARTLVAALSRTMLDSSLDRKLQWTAGMLAGHACSAWLRDAEGAVRFYTLARNRAGAGSPEELMAGAKIADAYAQQGDIAAARQANLELLSRSAGLSDAFVYRRAHARALEQEEQLKSATRR